MEGKNAPEVIILLSTFNGEKYLAEQLESIFNQRTAVPTVVIRDDGSQDSTLDIIGQFKKKYSERIILIEGENIGWKKSFYTLISYAREHFSEKKYFAFSDQDDIWFSDKLIKGIEELETLRKPIKLYCSNLLGLKDSGDVTMIRRDDLKPTYKNCLVKNRATGCTVIFNDKLLHALSYSDFPTRIAHDQWLYMVAVLCGEVKIDSSPHIHYRLHENNQIGNKTGIMNIWRRRISDYRNPDNFRLRENSAKILLQKHRRQMDLEAETAVGKIAHYRDTLENRFKLFFDKDYTTGNKWNDLFFRIRTILGII